mgnify:CR=1 FL=1
MSMSLQVKHKTQINSVVVSAEPMLTIDGSGRVRPTPPSPFPASFGPMIYDGCRLDMVFHCGPNIRAGDAHLSGVRVPKTLFYRCAVCGCRVGLDVRPALKPSQTRYHPHHATIDLMKRFVPAPTLAARTKHNPTCPHSMKGVKRGDRNRWKRAQARMWGAALESIRQTLKRARTAGDIPTFNVKLNASGVTEVNLSGH